MDNMPEKLPPTQEAESQRTLWMLECREGQYYKLVPIYALSEEDANELADRYIRESDGRLIRVNLQPFPGGFVLYRSRLPGKVE